MKAELYAGRKEIAIPLNKKGAFRFCRNTIARNAGQAAGYFIRCWFSGSVTSLRMGLTVCRKAQIASRSLSVIPL